MLAARRPPGRSLYLAAASSLPAAPLLPAPFAGRPHLAQRLALGPVGGAQRAVRAAEQRKHVADFAGLLLTARGPQRRRARRQRRRQLQQQRVQLVGRVLNYLCGCIHRGWQQDGVERKAAGGVASEEQLSSQAGKVGGVAEVDVLQAAPLDPGAKAAQHA